MEDTEFWDQWMHRPEFGTPHYYGPWLERFPDRASRVLTEIARAQPGGVACHDMGGRDRTGLVTMLVLRPTGVLPEAVAEDYALSNVRIPDPLSTASTPSTTRRRPPSSRGARRRRRRALPQPGRRRGAARARILTPSSGLSQCCWSPVAAGGRDSSASDVIVSWPRAASSSTPVASSAERA